MRYYQPIFRENQHLFSPFQFNLVCDMDMARANLNMLFMAGTLSGAFIVGIISDSYDLSNIFPLSVKRHVC